MCACVCQSVSAYVCVCVCVSVFLASTHLSPPLPPFPPFTPIRPHSPPLTNTHPCEPDGTVRPVLEHGAPPHSHVQRIDAEVEVHPSCSAEAEAALLQLSGIKWLSSHARAQAFR